MKNRAVSIDNISIVSYSTDITNYHSNNKERNDDIIANSEKPSLSQIDTASTPAAKCNGRELDDEDDNIIPWRAQLRKTNSRLSLI